MKTENRYFQFPLFLLRDLMTDKNKAMNNIIRYGLFSFAEKSKYDINDVIRQLIYCYYRNRAEIWDDLYQMVDSHVQSGDIEIDEDYSGFKGWAEFDPEIETLSIEEIFKTDSAFRDKAIDWHRVRQSYSFMQIEGDYQNAFNVGKKIHSTIPAGEPMPMVDKKLLFEFRDSEKSEFEMMQFVVNIGIRSIIGEKNFVKTNKLMILCRAFGYNTIKDLPNQMPDVYYKYSKRYHIDKVLERLELDNWNLHFYSHNIRGIYVGFKKKISLEDLIRFAEMKKRKNKIQDLKNAKKAAREKVLQQIGY